MFNSKIKLLIILFILGGFLGVGTQNTIAEEKKDDPATQFIPILTYRSGPFGAGGSGNANGQSDYYKLINNRDGGVNGVKLVFEECEFGYKTKKGVQCVKDFIKKYGEENITVIQPLSTGVTKALNKLSIEDDLYVPIVALAYGEDGMATGLIANSFILGTNYSNAAARKIGYIAELEYKKQKTFLIGHKKSPTELLKGLTIVNSHLHHPYGYESRAILDLLAKNYGFKVVHIANKWPAIDQSETFEQIKKINPDYIINREWGASCSAPYLHAKQIGFPANKIINVHWCGAEEDMLNAGDLSKGAIAIEYGHSTNSGQIFDDLRKYVFLRMAGTGSSTRVGTTYYNRGLVSGMIVVEAIRAAQERSGKVGESVTAEDMVEVFQNLNITTERLKEINMDQLTGPYKVSCGDHGLTSVPLEVKQWTGSDFKIVSKRKLYFQKEVAEVVNQKADALADKFELEDPDCD